MKKTEIKGLKLLPSRLIGEGLCVGIVSGIVVMLYRIILHKAEGWLDKIIRFTSGSNVRMLGWFIVLMLFAFIVYKLLKFEPLISGSGIPQLEGEMTGKLDQTWWKVLPAKFIGGFLCIFSGLSLGREGPSIQLGAMGGKAVAKLLKTGKTEQKYLLTCGASAGLAAAFHAPLAGVMFSLEEIHKNFSVSVLMSVMTASVTADFLTSNIVGSEPIFQFAIIKEIPLKYYGYILLMGIILGFFGVFYNWFTLKAQSIFGKINNQFVRIAVPFIIAGILAYTAPILLGSGGGLITSITSGEFTILIAVLILVGKFLFSGASFGSGAPGGIFFPLLVLGGMSGGIFAMICSKFFTLPYDFVNNFVLLAMAGFFTAIVRAPLTGIILIFEMTGSLSQLMSLLLVSLSAYIVATLLKSEPIYESLLERILKKNGKQTQGFTGEKVLKEYVIMHGSPLDNKKIADVKLPNGVLILSIHRLSEEILPKGSTILNASDSLLVIMNDGDESMIDDEMHKLCTEINTV